MIRALLVFVSFMARASESGTTFPAALSSLITMLFFISLITSIIVSPPEERVSSSAASGPVESSSSSPVSSNFKSDEAFRTFSSSSGLTSRSISMAVLSLRISEDFLASMKIRPNMGINTAMKRLT